MTSIMTRVGPEQTLTRSCLPPNTQRSMPLITALEDVWWSKNKTKKRGRAR